MIIFLKCLIWKFIILPLLMWNEPHAFSLISKICLSNYIQILLFDWLMKSYLYFRCFCIISIFNAYCSLNVYYLTSDLTSASFESTFSSAFSYFRVLIFPCFYKGKLSQMHYSGSFTVERHQAQCSATALTMSLQNSNKELLFWACKTFCRTLLAMRQI